MSCMMFGFNIVRDLRTNIPDWLPESFWWNSNKNPDPALRMRKVRLYRGIAMTMPRTCMKRSAVCIYELRPVFSSFASI